MAKNNLIQLEQYADLIDTSMPKDFSINKKCLKDTYIYTFGNEMR